MEKLSTERLTENLDSLLVRTRSKDPESPSIRFFDMFLECCDGPAQYVCFRCHTYSWMANYRNVVHGGMIATILDHSMGIVCHALYETMSRVPIPTTSITVNYARPVPVGIDVLIQIRIVSAGKSVAQLVSEIALPDAPHIPLATAVSTFHTALTETRD